MLFNGDGYFTETKKFQPQLREKPLISADYPGDGKLLFLQERRCRLGIYGLPDRRRLVCALRNVTLGYKFNKSS